MNRDRRSFLRCGAAAILAAGARGRAQAPATPGRRILYVAGRFSSPRAAAFEAAVAAIGPSEFNVIILAFAQASYRQGRLRLLYNGVPPRRLSPRLSESLRQLRGGFRTRKRILLSLGGWGNAATFAAIRSAGVDAFLRQLDDEIVGPLGLDGLDLDLEPGTKAENTPAGWHAVHDDLGGTLVTVTNAYMRRHPGHWITHAPISSVAAALYVRDGKVRGIPGSIFQATRAGTGNNIAWLNVQFYEAGDPKPQPVAAYYRDQLLQPLLDGRRGTGLARPWEALALGFEPHYHQNLEACEATLRAVRRATAGSGPPGGAFVWQYGQIAHEVKQWGTGLREAVT